MQLLNAVGILCRQAREDVNQHHVRAARGLYEGHATDLAHAGKCQLDCSTGGSG